MLTGSLLERLIYNPETGDWTYRTGTANNSKRTGQPAGYFRDDGYRLIRIEGIAYYSGRLAWLYMTGEWPHPEVDHIDRNPSNDRWDNLREATSSQNKYNREMNYFGYRGVYPCGKKWQVHVGGVYLGVFDALEDAIELRDSVATEWAGPFAYLNNLKEGVPQ